MKINQKEEENWLEKLTPRATTKTKIKILN